MPFTLESRYFINQSWLGSSSSQEHEVLKALRVLHPGKVLKTWGDVATDQEAKGPWESANVRIKIGFTSLELNWDCNLLLMFLNTHGYFDSKTITPAAGPEPIDLSDIYHSVGVLPTAFSFIQRMRLPKLISTKIQQLDGIRYCGEETVLKYTLK